MLRLVLFLAGILAAAMGLDWLANRPGTMTMAWQGYVIETTRVPLSAGADGAGRCCARFAWGAIRRLWRSPAVIGQFVHAPARAQRP